jgi:TRAP-type C4-dicarboxylate transport system permease small subunit
MGNFNLKPDPGTTFGNLGNITAPNIISAFITLVLIIAALVFFFMLVWGGIKYITSAGDKAQTESARNQITAALIGLVIVFAAWAIINLINVFFGINIFSLNFPTAGGE